MSAMLPQPTANLVPQQQQQLSKNPMLPQLPQTGNMDSEYLAAEAQMRAQVAKQYADILQQLGWVDESGQFMPGSVSVNAARSQADLGYQSERAEQGVTEESQRGGTLFSGKRAERTAQAQQPFQRQIAQLGVDTPLALGKLYEQAAGLVDQYTLQNNLLMAQMAGRQAAAIARNPAGTQQQQEQGNQAVADQAGVGGGYGPQESFGPWNPPDYGPQAGYTPAGSYSPATGQIKAPGGGTYTSGGGQVGYQSNKGKYGKKPVY